METLVLVVTRRCTQRCTYCPVSKDGRPDMLPETAHRALGMFTSLFGGGHLKLFGGEPLLSPDLVDEIVERAECASGIAKVTLCTNGGLLDEALLERFETRSKLWLTISLDGKPDDHHAGRRPACGAEDALARIESLLPRLRRFPRLVVTQVISPATAARAAANFEYLLGLGFRRFNLLPASWVVWSSGELAALRRGLEEISADIRAEWRDGRSLYLRNLFVRTCQPTFSSGVVVDVDGDVFPSDCILADLEDSGRAALRCGTVNEPPAAGALRRKAGEAAAILERHWPASVVESTRAADAVLDGFYRSLMREYLAHRRKGSATPAVSRLFERHGAMGGIPRGRDAGTANASEVRA